MVLFPFLFMMFATDLPAGNYRELIAKGQIVIKSGGCSFFLFHIFSLLLKIPSTILRNRCQPASQNKTWRIPQLSRLAPRNHVSSDRHGTVIVLSLPIHQG